MDAPAEAATADVAEVVGGLESLADEEVVLQFADLVPKPTDRLAMPIGMKIGLDWHLIDLVPPHGFALADCAEMVQVLSVPAEQSFGFDSRPGSTCPYSIATPTGVTETWGAGRRG